MTDFGALKALMGMKPATSPGRILIRRDTSVHHEYEVVGPKGIYSRHGSSRYPGKSSMREVEEYAINAAKVEGLTRVYNSVTEKDVEVPE